MLATNVFNLVLAVAVLTSAVLAACGDHCLGARRDYALQLTAALLEGPVPRADGALEVGSGPSSIDMRTGEENEISAKAARTWVRAFQNMV